jgi:protein involved in temperature-dependent protein secretion
MYAPGAAHIRRTGCACLCARRGVLHGDTRPTVSGRQSAQWIAALQLAVPVGAALGAAALPESHAAAVCCGVAAGLPVGRLARVACFERYVRCYT